MLAIQPVTLQTLGASELPGVGAVPSVAALQVLPLPTSPLDRSGVSREAFEADPAMGGFLSALTSNYACPACTPAPAPALDPKWLYTMAGLLPILAALLEFLLRAPYGSPVGGNSNANSSWGGAGNGGNSPWGFSPVNGGSGNALYTGGGGAAAAPVGGAGGGSSAGGSGRALPYTGGGSGGSMDPNAIHMTQVYDEKYNPNGAPRSSDCGPTSLAVALEALGLNPSGSAQDKIDAARLAMFEGADPSRDGYDEKGNRVQEEHSTPSDVADVARGAERAGAETYEVRTVQEVADAVSQGHPVVLGGKNSGQVYGAGNGIEYNGGHFICVSGYDKATDTFVINDPLSHGGPLRVTRAQLEAYQFDGSGPAVDGVAIKRKGT